MPPTAPAVIVPLAQGFEEIEAITIVDVLRRAGLSTVFAGLKPGPVTGSHGIAITPDVTLEAVDSSACRLVVLPGGMPGATTLRDDPRVLKLLKDAAARGAVTAAICAAPIALARAGLTTGKRVTSYPGFEKELAGGKLATDRVVVDGNLITSRGPGTAMEFALALVGKLCGSDAAGRLSDDLLAAAAP